MNYKTMCMALIAIPMIYLCSCNTNKRSVTNTTTPVTTPYGLGSTLMTISGDGFSPRKAENKVMVNGREAYIISASAKQLLINVPLKPGRVAVTVTVHDQTSNTMLVRYRSHKAIAANMQSIPSTQF